MYSIAIPPTFIHQQQQQKYVMDGALKKSPWRCCWEFQKCLWYGWDFLCLPKLPLWSYNQRISFCKKKKNKDHHSNKPKIMINYSLNFINFLGMIFIQLALTFLLSGSCSVQGCFLIIICTYCTLYSM